MSLKQTLTCVTKAKNVFSVKRFLNVDSPSFTPLSPVTNTAHVGSKSIGISPKAAAAAIFTPKSSGTESASHVSKPSQSDILALNRDTGIACQTILYRVATARHTRVYTTIFRPGPISMWLCPVSQLSKACRCNHHLLTISQTDSTSSANTMSAFDPFTIQNMASLSDASHQPQINPYAQDGSNIGATSMFSGAAYSHPVRQDRALPACSVLTCLVAQLSPIRSSRSTPGEPFGVPTNDSRFLHSRPSQGGNATQSGNLSHDFWRCFAATSGAFPFSCCAGYQYAKDVIYIRLP